MLGANPGGREGGGREGGGGGGGEGLWMQVAGNKPRKQQGGEHLAVVTMCQIEEIPDVCDFLPVLMHCARQPVCQLGLQS